MRRLVLWLIVRLTPEADREVLVGDILEDLARVEGRYGSRAANRWLWHELVRVVRHAPAHRLVVARSGGMSHTPTRQQSRCSRLSVMATFAYETVRGLRTGRGSMMTVFVILTLSMSAGTVTFSIVDGIALRPLPYAEPDRLVGLSRPGRTPNTLSPVSSQEYFAWTEATGAFEGIAAARPGGQLLLEVDGAVEPLTTQRVTANLFTVLGIQPLVGRFFTSEHERPGSPSVVILSYDLWSRKFRRRDPAAVGRQLSFQDGLREVIGILPAGIWYPITTGPQPDVYVPYVATPAERSSATPGRAYSMRVVGRLRREAGLEQARADVNRVSPAIVSLLHGQIVGSQGRWLLLALAAVGLVMLVACANVANLLLARAVARSREFATREALGASRARLAAGLLIEGLMLAFASSVAALIVSFWGVDLFKSSVPQGLLAGLPGVSVDGRVLSASLAAAVLCGLLAAGAPAWLAARTDLVQLMKAGGGTLIGGRRQKQALSAFLVADVAFVCVLLVASTLVITSFILVTTADLGFDRRNVMALSYTTSVENIAESNRAAAAAVLRAEVLASARTVPGVSAVALASNATLPLSGSSVRYSIVIPGFGETPRDDLLETNMVTEEYFRVMGMELLRGRTFLPSDRAGAPLVMVINDVAARRFFPNRDPIGQVVEFRGPTTIVGVLRGVHFEGPEADVRPAMYIPIDQEPFRPSATRTFGTVLTRTEGDARRLAPMVREAVRPAVAAAAAAANPSAGAWNLLEPRFVDDHFHRLTAGRRFNAGVMAAFGVIALAIGAVGVYGAMAFTVGQEVRTIGLRMALGASPKRVLHSVLGQALRRVVVGMGIGLTCSWTASSLLVSFVFGIQPSEPGIYALVALLMLMVGVAAALIPAVRASRTDPLTALRLE